MSETNKWNLENWININGNSPVEEEFDRIKVDDAKLFNQIVKKINYLRRHRISDLKKVELLEILKSGRGLYELKIKVSQEFRILGVLRENEAPPVLYALHAFIKKDQEIRQKDINTTVVRLEEFNK